MVKLNSVVSYLKKIQKSINYVTHFMSSADINIFSPEISNFFTSRNTDVGSNSFNLFDSLNVALKNGCNYDDVSKIGYSRTS